ncbi:Gfo/Idh/MocA family protein [Thalassobacillus pellis]|uniref:Gfo/Idh/MocA family protein n=1 Tax=Thalassobacillus pellis TaxID=748008 RepID=UPI0019614ED6|nr:Gfo/Idh/MocA family oxidoreductase [Thalassobacillus pellis]MBM7552584.1 putative dehydrogenase [Thalassobacillus pellis]
MSHIVNEVLLVGAGNIAVEYTKVLKALGIAPVCIGRSQETCRYYYEKTGVRAHSGGLKKYLSKKVRLPSVAINCVNVDQLAETTSALLENGVSTILVEKPGGLDVNQLKRTHELASQSNGQVYIAYNRRFYSSTAKAKKIIEADGGVQSFHFDFTELGHRILHSTASTRLKENWLLANSTHVIDLAFFLGGEPQEIHAYKSGNLSWHPSGAIFTGSGKTTDGVLFSYHANWSSPGRWGVELTTTNHRLKLQPLETLAAQKIDTFQFQPVPLADKLDQEYKPGLYQLVKTFLENKNDSRLVTIADQYNKTKHWYEAIKNSTN